MATKRSRTKHPGLKKELYSKIKQQYYDIDYVNSLSDEEKQWLNDFMTEFLGANLKESETLKHNNKTLSKSVYDANNARNRDIYNIARTGGRLDSLDEALLNQLEESEIDEEFEDRLIDKIDEES